MEVQYYVYSLVLKPCMEQCTAEFRQHLLQLLWHKGKRAGNETLKQIQITNSFIPTSSAHAAEDAA